MASFAELATGATELQVHINRGDIGISSSESAGWTLECSGGDEPQIERRGEVISVQQIHGSRRLDVRLTVPSELAAVTLHTGMGRIEAEGLHGRLRLASGHGQLVLKACEGEAEASTGNGKLVVESYQGALKASSGNGGIHLRAGEGEATLSTGNGNVELRAFEGTLRATTGHGDVAMSEVAGEAKAETGHGQIRVEAARELALRATTGAGSIRVDGSSVRALRLNSNMGNITCAATLRPGNYEFSSGMGSVTVELPANIRARVDAQTGFGHIQSDFPLVRVGRTGPMGFGGERMVGSIGEGEPEVEIGMRSGNGQLRLRQTGPVLAGEQWTRREAPTPPPAPDVPAAAPGAPEEPRQRPALDSTLAILEALARGDISTAEAEDLLSSPRLR